MIKKILDSQKAWAKRVGFYYHNNEGDYKTAWEHHFGAMKVSPEDVSLDERSPGRPRRPGDFVLFSRRGAQWNMFCFSSIA